MMIIDGHVHIGKWADPNYFGLEWGLEKTELELKKCGIGGALVMPTDAMNNEAALKEVLGRAGKGMKYWFFPWVSPKGSHMEFLELNKKHIAGIKFHGPTCGVRITDPSYKDFLAFAHDNSLPVLAHAGKWQEMSSYRYVIELAKAYPEIRFIMAHQGGPEPELKVGAARAVRKEGLENVWLDTSATREFWTISMGIKELGAERFIMGSDFPVSHPKLAVDNIDILGLDSGDKKKILGGNFLEVMGGKRCRF